MTQTKEEELLIFLRGSKSTNCLSDKEIELIAKFLEYAEQLTRQKDERIAELEKALDEIMYPVKYMQMRAKEQGAELNGYMAVQLSDSPSHLKQIAQKVMIKQ
jgi:hypothetical protein